MYEFRFKSRFPRMPHNAHRLLRAAAFQVGTVRRQGVEAIRHADDRRSPGNLTDPTQSLYRRLRQPFLNLHLCTSNPNVLVILAGYRGRTSENELHGDYSFDIKI